ncbi:serine hydrolase [Nonomuraea sp. NPDC005692]|uniref:serine hydrolase n=1 Tax=Nonomuraea sp. NPDC005692 TaxID=3157168 RepID=UPI0033E47144
MRALSASRTVLPLCERGPAGLTRYYRSLGDPIGRLDRYEPELNDWKPGEKRDTVKPAFMARNLQRLSLGDALVPEDRQRLNDWLRASITGAERIRAGVPRDWVVGDKTGGGVGAYAPGSDIAVAWPPSGAPVIIAIYTNRNDPTATMDNSVIAKAATLPARALGYSIRPPGAREQGDTIDSWRVPSTACGESRRALGQERAPRRAG